MAILSPNKFGPVPSYGRGGAEAIHAQIYDLAIGKTISKVFLGDAKAEPSESPDNSPPDGIFRGEYLVFEFTDGTYPPLEVGAGNSFHVAPGNEADRLIAHATSPPRLKLVDRPPIQHG